MYISSLCYNEGCYNEGCYNEGQYNDAGLYLFHTLHDNRPQVFALNKHLVGFYHQHGHLFMYIPRHHQLVSLKNYRNRTMMSIQ